jgi:hypothetical protein
VTPVDVARMLVSRHLTDPTDEIVRVAVEREGVVVEGRELTWYVAPFALGGRDPSFTIYDVTLDLMTDPARRPDGYAVFSDGVVLALRVRTDIAAFCEKVGRTLRLDDLATLLARYQNDGAARVVSGDSEALELIETIAPGRAGTLSPLRVNLDADGKIVGMAFDSWRLQRDTLRVDRWQVELPDFGAGAGISWETSRVAGD